MGNLDISIVLLSYCGKVPAIDKINTNCHIWQWDTVTYNLKFKTLQKEQNVRWGLAVTRDSYSTLLQEKPKAHHTWASSSAPKWTDGITALLLIKGKTVCVSLKTLNNFKIIACMGIKKKKHWYIWRSKKATVMWLQSVFSLLGFFQGCFLSLLIPD